jgi:hypothetical protein|tara:strand:- start:315 stop:497 length:183 start_codon:yes stop_codon:yes gene_type:complete
MPGHYGMKKITGKSSDMLKQKSKRKAPKRGSAKMSPPARDSGKRMTPAMKAALRKKLGKK